MKGLTRLNPLNSQDVETAKNWLHHSLVEYARLNLVRDPKSVVKEEFYLVPVIMADVSAIAAWLRNARKQEERRKAAARAASRKPAWERWLSARSSTDRMVDLVLVGFQNLDGQETEDLDDRVQRAEKTLSQAGIEVNDLRARLSLPRYTLP